MNPGAREGIAKLLSQAISAIRKNDSFTLKGLSSNNIQSAFVFQDEDSLTVSVVMYALSKIVDRTSRKAEIVSWLERASGALASGNEERYRYFIRQLIKAIEVEDSRLKKFVFSVIEQAQVKKGCALCEHGLSIGRVAKLLGISRWELSQYLGKTHTGEQSSENVPTEKRLELARGIFA